MSGVGRYIEEEQLPSLTHSAQQQLCCNRLTGRERERERGKHCTFLLYTSLLSDTASQWQCQSHYVQSQAGQELMPAQPSHGSVWLCIAATCFCRLSAPTWRRRPRNCSSKDRASISKGGGRSACKRNGEVSFHFLSVLVLSRGFASCYFHFLRTRSLCPMAAGPCSAQP